MPGSWGITTFSPVSTWSPIRHLSACFLLGAICLNLQMEM